MLMTIVAIWAIVIPLAVLAVSWQAARLREDAASQTADRSVPPPRVASRFAARLCPTAPRGRAGPSRVASARSSRAARGAARPRPDACS